MARVSYFARLAAIIAMLQFAGDVALARPVFEQCCPNHGIHESLDDFLRRWYGRYQHRKEGECFLAETNRPGPKRRLEEKDVQRAANAFANGYYSNGKKKPWLSVNKVRGRLCKATAPPLARAPRLLPLPQQQTTSFPAPCTLPIGLQEERSAKGHHCPLGRLTGLLVAVR